MCVRGAAEKGFVDAQGQAPRFRRQGSVRRWGGDRDLTAAAASWATKAEATPERGASVRRRLLTRDWIIFASTLPS